ncbi:MAG: hypothetical protein ACK4SM_04475 [Aquificaceae bacterium]
MDGRSLVWGFEDAESAVRYFANYLLYYIHTELEALPKGEWDKTLDIWAKICNFASSFIDRDESQRHELYKKYKFDPMMVGIVEDLRHSLMGAYFLGLLGKKDPPYRLLEVAARMVLEREDLLQTYGLRRQILEYILHSL